MLVLGIALVGFGAGESGSVLPRAEGADKRDKRGALKSVQTGRRGERVRTVPIAPRVGARARSVLSVRLPRLHRNELVRFNGEVTISTTCVDQNSRCIGRSYRYDPHLRARVVLARSGGATGGKPVSGSVGLSCEQTRPNRNHHCPLVIERGSFRVRSLRDLPCPPDRCRLNMTVDAFHGAAESDQVVVVGSDQPDGSVEGGKARLSAVTSRGRIKIDKWPTRRRLARKLPASFEGGKAVVYSQRLDAKAGDVLMVRAKQVTAIRRYPYFISDQVVVSTRRRAIRPSALTRRVVSRSGLATETNGFNCTLGPSAFRSPCATRKAGLVEIETTPRDGRGKRQPLFVNLVSRGFPKLAQARGSYPPARILDRGSLVVRRLRAMKRRR